MKTIYAKNFDRRAYVHHLAGQYLIFSELERVCERHKGAAPLKSVYDEALLRTAALDRDLRFWCGGDAAAVKSALEGGAAAPQVSRYLKRLAADAGDAWMVLCHHFLQYNAVLSGGQFLGGMVAARAQNEGLSGSGGAEFYEFAASCQPTHARVQRYIDDMDSLDISEAQKEKMLACMQEVYAALLGMFDEAYALAPIQGVSYQESKSSGASGAGAQKKKKKGPPPPPMEPGPRTFTLEQLAACGADSKQLLTAVLGRVYDVTVGREFFGPDGPYAMFSGNDGTYNLAVMSLKKPTLNKFEYELDSEDKECLADWLAYFDNRYGQPLGMLDKKHSVSLQDLPRATKIPFSGVDDDDDEEPAPAAAPAAAQPQSKL